MSVKINLLGKEQILKRRGVVIPVEGTVLSLIFSVLFVTAGAYCTAIILGMFSAASIGIFLSRGSYLNNQHHADKFSEVFTVVSCIGLLVAAFMTVMAILFIIACPEDFSPVSMWYLIVSGLYIPIAVILGVMYIMKIIA